MNPNLQTDDDITSKVRKQEDIVRKQQAMRQKMIQQQKHKEMLSQQNSEKQQTRQPPIAIAPRPVPTLDTVDIEQQIMAEIKRKETELLELEQQTKTEMDHKIHTAIQNTRNENQQQLIHYNRLFSNMNQQLADIKQHVHIIKAEIATLLSTSNRTTKRSSSSKIASNCNECENIIDSMMKQEKHRTHIMNPK